MTRADAIDKVQAAVKPKYDWDPLFAGSVIDSLIALDLLKVDEELSALGHAKIIAVGFTKSGMSMHEMFHEFDKAGLKIVKQDSR